MKRGPEELRGEGDEEELEKKLRKKIVIKSKAGFHQEQFNIIEI
jgi:hypothetical protein